MRSENSSDLVRELLHIQSSADLDNWKQQHDITSDLINEVMAEVRHLLEAGEFDAANLLSDWCVRLAEGLTDSMLQAGVAVTKGIALARRNEDASALPYFDRALQLY